MRFLWSALISFLFFSRAFAEVYYSEEFKDGDGWKDRWVVSKFKGAETGAFDISAGQYYGDAEADKGLRTSQDARFYQASAEFQKEFNNDGKALVLQYSIKHEQNIDCGGGYLKLHPAGIERDNYNGDSNYNIMFGPDICGPTKKVHLIFNYKGKNVEMKKELRAESDTFTHVYTLILNPDQTYKILIDNKESRAGNLIDDWDFLPPKQIKDPNVSKPADWVDEREIDDPDAKKPADWDSIPAKIADPDAKKPDDWDDELDGEWEAPIIDNPEYKGEWKAPRIPNPAYKGEWEHPLIANPDYYEDSNIYKYSNKFVGIEIWQVKSGTIFDNILVTDDVSAASTAAERILKSKEIEKKLHDEAEAEKRKKEEEESKNSKDIEVEVDGEDDEEKEADDDEHDDHDDHVHDEL